MKKYVYVIIGLLLVAGESMAQYADRPAVSLQERMRADAPSLYRSYRTGRALSKTGTGLLIGGLGGIVIGASIGVATQEDDDNESAQANSAMLVGFGLVATFTGVPLMIVGFSKKGRARRAYRRQFGDITLQAPGIHPAPHLEIRSNGLAYVF